MINFVRYCIKKASEKLYGPVESSGVIKEASTYSVLDLGDGVAKLLCDSLTLECLDRIGVRRGRHDNKCHNCDC